MAIITWQNVPIPQFLGVQQGIANAAQFLNQATHSGLGALNLIQRHMQDQADRAILDRMLAVQDPQEYALQMQQGAILGPEKGRASLDTLLAAARHLDTLQARADARYKSERARMLDTDRDRISEAVNAALTAGILGDPGQGALQLMAAQGHLDNTLDAYRLLAQMANQQAANAARLESARIRYSTPAARLEREILIKEYAGKLFPLLQNPDLFEDAVAKLPYHLQGPVREEALKMFQNVVKIQDTQNVFNQQFLNRVFGGQTMEGDRSNNALQNSIRIPPRLNPNGGFTYYGAANRMVNDGKILQADGSVVDINPEKPLTELPGREIRDLLLRSIEATKSAHPELRARLGLPEGQGTSAMGLYQLTYGAMFGNGKNGLVHRIWGDDWENVYLMTPENQEKMARLLFEQYRGKGLKKAWVALPPIYDNPEFTKDLNWEEVRITIPFFESGYRPESYDREIEIIRNMLNRRRMSPIGLALQQAEKNQNMDIPAVVTEILKTPGVDKDFKREEIHNIISKYVEENPELSPAEAGAIFLHTYGKLDPNSLIGKNRVNAIIKQMQTTGKAELEEQREIEKYWKNIEDARTNFWLAYRDLYGSWGALANLQRNPNDPDAARLFNRTLNRLEYYSRVLENLVLNNPLKALSQKVERKEYEEDTSFDRLIRAMNEQERLRLGSGISGGFMTPGAISF